MQRLIDQNMDAQSGIYHTRGLLDELVPDVAAVVEDMLVRFKHSVGSQFRTETARRFPAGLSLGISAAAA